MNNQFEEREKGQVRKLLRLKAFYYSNGPWRNCWVKLGYDPKLNPLSVQYQVLELRAFFNKDLRTGEALIGTLPEDSTKRSHILDDLVNPLSISHLFQICDIHDEEIQNQIQEIFQSRKIPPFNLKTGWLTSSVKENLILRIKMKWAKALHQIKTWRSSTEFPVSFNRPSKKTVALKIPEISSEDSLDEFQLLESDDDFDE